LDARHRRAPAHRGGPRSHAGEQERGGAHPRSRAHDARPEDRRLRHRRLTSAALDERGIEGARMKVLTRLFLRGLAAILPLGATLYLLYWLGSTAESLLAPGLERVLPGGWYLTGMGVAAGLVVVLVIGALMTTYVANWILAQGEHLVERIPVVKTVYTSLKDTVNLFADEDRERPNRPVIVEWGEPKTRILGFLTRESVGDVVQAEGEELV